MLIIQRVYSLSDEQTEYQINDRLSFQRFLGLDLSSEVPNYTTIWKFRERLLDTGTVDRIFVKLLTDRQKTKNKSKSKVRARIEHIFGFIQKSMKGNYIKCIGIKRANGIIGLINITYNLNRLVQIER